MSTVPIFTWVVGFTTAAIIALVYSLIKEVRKSVKYELVLKDIAYGPEHLCPHRELALYALDE